MTALALHFAPTIDTSRALVSAMEHTLLHSELYQFVRLTSPSFLRWLIQEFDIKGEAYSTRSHVSMLPSMMTAPLQKCQPSLEVCQFTPHTKLNILSRLMTNFPTLRHSPTMQQCASLVTRFPYSHFFGNNPLLPKVLRDGSSWTHRHPHWWIPGQTLQPKDTQPLVTHLLRSTPPRTHLTHFSV